MEKCKYCDKKHMELGICGTCENKRPLVRKLVNLCQIIKKGS